MVSDVISAPVQTQQRVQLRIGGQVQGVGFRPFVYRLATQLHLTGWVRNDGAQVRIEVGGDRQHIEAFIARVISQAPAIAKPVLLECRKLAQQHLPAFEIQASVTRHVEHIHLPVDYYTCPECLAELSDPTNRRYHYPFINCTQCGPRYTIIKALPYDRRNTSMADFQLCPSCQAEYTNPRDRRFHAEPIACAQCGPRLSYADSTQHITDSDAALAACVKALQAGEIVAIQGIGGFHLCGDASNPHTIESLRARKQRPHKPLAVMFAEQGEDGLQMVREYAKLDDVSAQALRSPARPIVLVPLLAKRLPEVLAPGLGEIGAMLPYSPLHHLLLTKLARPMLATSANLSGEPVLTEHSEVKSRLHHVTQTVLFHNRPIVRPADDSVLRTIANQPRPLRLGRGKAPLELTLPHKLLQPVLACGGHMKNSLALAFDDRIVISSHIGDLDSPRSQQVFEQVGADLQALYQVRAQHLIVDAHRGYRSTRWAKQQALPCTEVFHHHAHAAVLAGEYPAIARWLVFTWDGVGYGEDGSLWGGEALYGRAGDWQRLASWRPFQLMGGDQVAQQPWRSAAALCWQAGMTFAHAPPDSDLAYQAWQQGMNSIHSAAASNRRPAAALIGVCTQASFDAQAPMWLEQLASQGQGEAIALPLAQDAQGVWRSDWQPLLALLQDPQRPPADRAHMFHLSVARALVDQACAVREQQGDVAVGLCGGVFQNKLLTEQVERELKQQGFRVFIPASVPMNDGGLCYGQVIEYAARSAKRD